MKKFLILFSLLIFNFLFFKGQEYYYGQLNKSQIDSTKVEIYKSILQLQEGKDKNDIKLISIQTVDLEIDYQTGYLSFLRDVNEKADTITVKKLKEEFSYRYWFYNEQKLDLYREDEKQSNLCYHFYIEETGHMMKDYTFIRIFKPLDKWINLYLYLSYLPDGEPYEIIPVLYTRIKNNKEVEKKYMFYEVRFSKEGKIESVKVVN